MHTQCCHCFVPTATSGSSLKLASKGAAAQWATLLSCPRLEPLACLLAHPEVLARLSRLSLAPHTRRALGDSLVLLSSPVLLLMEAFLELEQKGNIPSWD